MTAQQIHTPGTFDEYRRRASFARLNGRATTSRQYSPFDPIFRGAFARAQKQRDKSKND